MTRTRTTLSPKLAFRPLTPDRWDDFCTLFGDRGACGGCWCMWWRKPRSQFDKEKGAANKRSMKRLVESGEAPGIIAYDGREPIGWCAVAPRSDYPVLLRSGVLKPVDDRPVWSVVCFFVARSHRRQGVGVELLKASVRHAAKFGAKIVEGYPVEPKKDTMPDAFAWTGLASLFTRAGFVEVLRRSDTRPIMRYTIKAKA